MKISYKYLKNYLPSLPQEDRKLYDTLEDIGIEIKKISKFNELNVLNLELLANRGDHHCYLGIARELGGRVDLWPKEPKYFTENISIEDKSSIKLPEACYGISILKCELSSSLISLGDDVETILKINESYSENLFSNLENFVNLEIGQPILILDFNKIEGSLYVKQAVETIYLNLLDKEGLEIPIGALLLCDKKGPVALLGFGVCKHVAPDLETKNLLIVSGVYDPVTIRKNSSMLNWKNLSTTRLERGGDYSLINKGILRTLSLLNDQELIVNNSIKYLYESLNSSLFIRKIILKYEQLVNYYDYKFNIDEVCHKLNILGFETTKSGNDYILNIPKHRWWDIYNIEDVYEEIGRVFSYNIFPLSNIVVENISLQDTRYTVRKQIENSLVGNGFYEVITDSFYSRNKLELLQLSKNSSLNKHVELINSLDKNFSLLKNNNIIQLLDLIKYNRNYGVASSKIFEINKLFYNKKDNYFEKNILWGAVWGKESFGNWKNLYLDLDFWYLKGIVQELDKYIGNNITFKNLEENNDYGVFFHPKRTVKILGLHEKEIGFLGEINPRLAYTWELEDPRVYYFEIELDKISQINGVIEDDIEEIEEYMPIKRNIAMHIPIGINSEEIKRFIFNNLALKVLKIEVIDLFLKDEIRAYTFELLFFNDNSTSSDKINREVLNLKEKIAENFGNFGVNLR